MAHRRLFKTGPSRAAARRFLSADSWQRRHRLHFLFLRILQIAHRLSSSHVQTACAGDEAAEAVSTPANKHVQILLLII